MAREFNIITAEYNGDVEAGIAAIFADYPRTAHVESFGVVKTDQWYALVSWDPEAEARRPKVMQG